MTDSDKMLEKMAEQSPALREMFSEMQYGLTPKRRRFPGGFRYQYWGKFLLKSGVWTFCYSTRRNENGKFLSFTYRPVVCKEEWIIKDELEHRTRKAARTRALGMYHAHHDVQERNEAAYKKAQRKNRRAR